MGASYKTFLLRSTFVPVAEGVVQKCSVKKVCLEISQNSQENTGRDWDRNSQEETGTGVFL